MTTDGRTLTIRLLGCCIIFAGVVNAAKLVRKERPSVVLSDNGKYFIVFSHLTGQLGANGIKK